MSSHAASRFRLDMLWNLISMGVMGLCGIAANVLIGRHYDAQTLGLFNQVFAAYIVFSQFAVGGLHYSALKHVAELSHDPARRSAVIAGALVPTLLLAVIFTALYALAAQPFAAFVESPDVARGMLLTAPGLLFFALNKVLLGTLNGLSRLRIFAVLNAARPALLLAGLWVAAFRGQPGRDLPALLTLSEFAVFLVAAACIVPELRHSWAGWLQWSRAHLVFGTRSFLSGVMVELNTRVDVIILGYYLTDHTVGVYSFASTLMEGLFQVLVVLRNVYNPTLVKLLAHPDRSEFDRVVQRGKIITWLGMLGLATIVLALYPLGVSWVVDPDQFMAGWPILAILLTGVVLSAGYMPFNQVLMLAGRPGAHTLLMAAVVVFNLVGNLLLVPIWHEPGAAIATAAAFVFFAILLVILTRRLTGARL